LILLKPFRDVFFRIHQYPQIENSSSIDQNFKLATGLLPYAAPITGAFAGNNPKERCKDASRCRRGRKPLSATPGEGDKFAWSKFEQPADGPKGENHGWFS
jgi:hypothetical protein